MAPNFLPSATFRYSFKYFAAQKQKLFQQNTRWATPIPWQDKGSQRVNRKLLSSKVVASRLTLLTGDCSNYVCGYLGWTKSQPRRVTVKRTFNGHTEKWLVGTLEVGIFFKKTAMLVLTLASWHAGLTFSRQLGTKLMLASFLWHNIARYIGR